MTPTIQTLSQNRTQIKVGTTFIEIWPAHAMSLNHVAIVRTPESVNEVDMPKALVRAIMELASQKQ